MTTPFKNDYAFGLGVTTTGGHKMIAHGGGIEGFNTELEYYPEDKLTVVVLRNVNVGTGAPGEIAGKLAAVARGETVKLQSERKEITLDPKVLSRYVGAYQMPGGAGPGPRMVITLDGNQLSSQLGGQPRFPIFPESETTFFLKVVDAQLEFPKRDGPATQVTLHQNGRDITAKRLDDAVLKQAVEAAAANAKRFKDQTAAPGSEAALRKMIEDVRAGKPDYGTMSAGLAEATRQQLSQLQSGVTKLGAIQSVTFLGVGSSGADIYTVKFANGSAEYEILLAADGKIESARVRLLD
jgi:hypothetical protein